MTEDIRWKQRFNNFVSSMRQMQKAVALTEDHELSDLEKQGLIHNYETTFELAWKVVKDYLEEQGADFEKTPRGTIRVAFRDGIIKDGELWMEMLAARNRTTHTYNEEILDTLYDQIVHMFYPMLRELLDDFSRRHDEDMSNG